MLAPWRIPGTTVEQDPNFKYPKIDWGYNDWGSNDFSGVLSDGQSGISSMILTRKEVKNSQKSLIALKNRIICLGSNIDTRSAKNTVATSVNQTKLNGDVIVRYQDEKVEYLGIGNHVISSDIKDIIHDGFVYSFPKEGKQKVVIDISTRQGSWSEISQGSSEDILYGDIFSIWLEHNKSETEYYQYEIFRGDILTTISNMDITNAKDIHLVKSSDGMSAYGTIFSVSDMAKISLQSITIMPSLPISLIVEKIDEYTLSITCADLSQKLTEIKFTISWQGKIQEKVLPLPKGNEAGKSVRHILQLEK